MSGAILVLNGCDVFLRWPIFPLGAHFIGDRFIVAIPEAFLHHGNG